VYPDSPLVPETAMQIATLNEWFATKDYDTRHALLPPEGVRLGDHLLRDGPASSRARGGEARVLRIVEAYQAINYREDVAETCTEARMFYPEDTDVRRACGGRPWPERLARRARPSAGESAASRRVPPR
jgi:hypothetical protein